MHNLASSPPHLLPSSLTLNNMQFTNVIFIDQHRKRRRRAGLGERTGRDASRHLAPERGADGWQNTEGRMAKDSHSPFNWVGPESSSKASQPSLAYNLHKIMLCTLSNWLSILRMQSDTLHKSASSVFLFGKICSAARLLFHVCRQHSQQQQPALAPLHHKQSINAQSGSPFWLDFVVLAS